MNTSQVININGEELNYKEKMWHGNRYIITYITEYPENILCYLNQIVCLIHKKRCAGIICKNSIGECNKNTEIILGNLYLDPEASAIIIGRCVTKKKIILCGCESNNECDEISEIYGNQRGLIGMSFHALSYISFGLNCFGEIHIAVDTTTASVCDKYITQIYIGTTSEELEKIIRLRYNYNHYTVCDIYCNPGDVINTIASISI